MERLSLDEWGNIAKYLSNEHFQKLKPYFPEKDFIYLDWIRIKTQEKYFRLKTGLDIEQLMSHKTDKLQRKAQRFNRKTDGVYYCSFGHDVSPYEPPY